MAEQPPAFVVVDRRKFTAEGERRDAGTPEETRESAPQAKVVTMPARTPEAAADATAAGDLRDETMAGALEGTTGLAFEPDEPEGDLGNALNDELGDEMEPVGEPRSAAETAAQDAAYRQTSAELDSMIRQANPGARQPGAVTFEHVIQSFYLSAIMAMGAGAEPGQQPRVDILGARQSIDMLGVLEEKTRGNLLPRESDLLKGITFELRMMFMEMTNAIARQAQQAPPPGGLR